MQTLPQQERAEAYSITKQDGELDQQTAVRLKKSLAGHFRDQLTLGAPTDADEAGLRRLAAQIKAGKVTVKLHLRHPLHAKLYLLFRHDPVSPSIGFLGSSNLTFAGLSKQGELNVDVTDNDACDKLARWFEDRWKDRWCLDISKEIAEIIDQSWGPTGRHSTAPHLREDGVPPLARGAGGYHPTPHPQGFRKQTLRLPDRRSENRGPSCPQAQRRSPWRRGWPREDSDGYRARPDSRGRLAPGDADPLPSEHRADVGGPLPRVPCAIVQGAVVLEGDQSASGTTQVSAGDP